MLDRCPYCGSPMRSSVRHRKHIPLNAVDLDEGDDPEPADDAPSEKEDDGS